MRAAATFEIVCPAGWVRVDLTTDVAAQAREVAEASVRSDSSPRRAQVLALATHRLTQAFTALAESGAWCLLMPIGTSLGSMRPSLIVTPFKTPDGIEPMEALVTLASTDASAALFDADPLVALRTSLDEDVTAATNAAALELVSALPRTDPGYANQLAENVVPAGERLRARRVRHILGDVTDNERWADLIFSVTHLSTEDQTQLGDAVVALADQLALTFRWSA